MATESTVVVYCTDLECTAESDSVRDIYDSLDRQLLTPRDRIL